MGDKENNTGVTHLEAHGKMFQAFVLVLIGDRNKGTRWAWGLVS